MFLKPVKLVSNLCRRASTKPTTNSEIQPIIYNRNPRNLERLRLERKPTGYPLENRFIEYYHKLVLSHPKDYVVAQIVHNTNKVVIQASTNEWCISQHLYSKSDKMAYKVLAEVFAERCLESGINSFSCKLVSDSKKEKVQLFLDILKQECLILEEMPVYDKNNYWHRPAKAKPWTVLEDSDPLETPEKL